MSTLLNAAATVTASRPLIALRFPTILELIEFQIRSATAHCDINRNRLSLTGSFGEADIELAIHGFKATID